MKKIIKIISLVLVSVLFAGGFGVSAEVSVSAVSAIAVNAATGTSLFEKNADRQMPMASTTKIMTALLLAEQNTPDATLTVTREMVAVEGSSMGLLPGDTVSYYALMCGMLLASGNDAANTAAIAVAGSVNAFADMMNRKAREIGMQNTHFITPSGLDADGHYSTARDMAKLAAVALKNETFAKIAASSEITVSYGNPPYKRSLKNHNKLLSLYGGAVGVKTGFTKKSGRCLVSAAERSGAKVIAVTLNDPNDWDDHCALLDYGLSVLQPFPLQNAKVPLVGGYESDVILLPEQGTLYLTEKEISAVQITELKPKFIYAGAKKGEVAGSYTVKYDGKVIAQVPLRVCGDTVRKTSGKKQKINFSYVLKYIFDFSLPY